MSRVIPKEQLAGYQRWQAGSFDKPAQAGGEPARAGSPPPAQEAANLATAAEQAGEMVVDIPFPTAEDLARINEEARNEGYQRGYDDGYGDRYRYGYRDDNGNYAILAAILTAVAGFQLLN